MSDRRFDGIDLERHLRLLRRATSAELAICDREGRVIAGSAGGDGTALEPVLAELGEQARDLASPGDQARIVDVGAGDALLQAPILDHAGEPVGWLNALRADREDDDLASHLQEIAASVSAELRLHEEVQGLAKELGARYEELNLVYEFDARSRSFAGTDREAEAILSSFADHIHVDVVALVLGDRPRPIHVARGNRIFDVDLLLTQLRGDVFRYLAVSREPLLLSRADESLRSFVFANLPYHLVACPVFIGTQPAMLALVRCEQDEEFSNSDRNLAAMLAGHAAIVMHNQAMTRNLETFSAQMAAALIEAVEAKDPYTRGHSERVQTVSVDLGRAASLSSRDLEGMSWGALLHDIGKIGVPDQILCKRGSLTREEYTLIKVHPERSYEIMRHVDGLSGTALSAARYHQEKYDGSGYPHGLSGTQIPVEARVVAVADTYDAITSSRSYRAGLSHEIAIARIREAAGSQLDPSLVAMFLTLCEQQPVWKKKSAPPREDD